MTHMLKEGTTSACWRIDSKPTRSRPTRQKFRNPRLALWFYYARAASALAGLSVTVLQQILEWSKDRPAWQRDALRRLVLNDTLSDDDIQELTDICKSAHGLAEQQVADLLAKEHVPDKAAGAAPVTLISIFHHCGVNALAESQTLKFAPGLTVVYGDNGAGKTGYIRILKNACRARGQEKILGNVVSGTAPLTPVVAIRYKVGAETDSRESSGDGEDEFVSRYSKLVKVVVVSLDDFRANGLSAG